MHIYTVFQINQIFLVLRPIDFFRDFKRSKIFQSHITVFFSSGNFALKFSAKQWGL